MTRRRWIWTATAAAVTLTASMTTAVAVADGNDRAPGKVKACVHKRTGDLRLAPSCKRSEKRITWAKRGAAGPAGPVGSQGVAGPAGALTSTVINVEYDVTRATPHEFRTPGGASFSFDCGSKRIGTLSADLSTFADEIHGTTTLTQYGPRTVISSSTYAIDARSAASLGNVPTGGNVTHSTQNFSGIVTDRGVASQVVMYLSRDTRQGRPACQLIGSVTELGPATVVPS